MIRHDELDYRKLGYRELGYQVCELAQQLRVDATRAAAEAGSGHLSSSLSASDALAVLLAGHLRYDFAEPEARGNDRLVFSKGHASPLLYAALRSVEAISDEELLSFRSGGSRLEGHPTPRLPWVDVATGSLGQGLPIGVGMALAARWLDRLGYRVWVLCGDGELAEGSMAEAVEHAGYAGLDGLTAIVDVNRLGQRGPTRHEWDTAAYARRFQASGWHTVEVDGHDLDALDAAYDEAAATTGAPSAILARTVKGKGIAALEDQVTAHGTPAPETDSAIAELGGRPGIRVAVRAPEAAAQGPAAPEPAAQGTDAGAGEGAAAGAPEETLTGTLALPEYELGGHIATRTAFGSALSALGHARGDVVALDGEVSDSTRLGYFAEAHPGRFFQFHIAEQQMVAAGVGMQTRGWTPYLATFAAFFSRAADILRMATISGADLQLAGSHAGCAIGPDGPSQMGLEDLALFRALWRTTVLYPCDANQTAALVPAMADNPGINYLRTTRGETPVIYEPGQQFPIGGSRVLRTSPEDRVTVVAAGVTVAEALTAADRLADEDLAIRVIDAYSITPIDAATLAEAATETGGIVTVEDHWPRGGLGDAVLEALAGRGALCRLTKLGVRTMPASDSPAGQLRVAGIDAAAIADAARALANPA